jgi:hypothetical protein
MSESFEERHPDEITTVAHEIRQRVLRLVELGITTEQVDSILDRTRKALLATRDTAKGR